MRFLVVLFVFLSFCYAHKVNLFVTTQKDKIEIYSYFGNGASCNACKLFIKNEGIIILEDKLNEDGLYLYTPKNKNIEVVIDAGNGHIAKEKLEIKNIKKEDISKHKNKENKEKYLKIVLGILILFVFFYLLKRFKK